MKNYSYIVLDKKGREVHGTLVSSSVEEAESDLRLQGFFIIEVVEDLDRKQKILSYLAYLNPYRYKPVKQADLLLFFRQMALLLRSGHTVVQALESVEPMIKRFRLKRSIQRMIKSVQSGATFSGAMGEQKSVFPTIAVSLLGSGEATGELDKVMTRLAADLDKTMEIKRKLVASLTYPVIVIIASVAVILFLVLGVVPKFATFLEGKGSQLPPSTQALMDMSEWMQINGFALMVVVLTVIMTILVSYTRPKGKYIVDRVFLKIPLIGSSIIAASMAKTSWTLSMVLSSGLSVLDSMRVAAMINGNSVIKRSFNDAADGVTEGEKLAVAMKKEGVPDMVLHLTSAGEESGELSAVFDELGSYYHKELDARINAMTSMIEPILTLMVGGMVGFVYISFFQAIFAVANGG